MNQEEISAIYHEKQRFQLCAVHAMNNLLQKSQFEKKDLDHISAELSSEQEVTGNSFFSSISLNSTYKGWLGFGDYDVTVIIRAFQSINLEVVWFDSRKEVHEIDFDDDSLAGLIINLQPDNVLKKISSALGLASGRHWKAVTKIDGLLYDLDSELESPKALGAVSEIHGFLEQLIKQNKAQILLVKK